MSLENWSRNLTYGANRIYSPRTVEEVQDLVQSSLSIKALGTRHSFNKIADTTGDLISTEHLSQIEQIDHAGNKVTVGAGIRYGELCEHINQQGYALPNMASLPHISVAGACVTGTHGSGDHNGNLSTSVSALEIVVADGSIVRLSRAENPGQFHGAVVNLGAFGIVTKLTLDLIPSFSVRQDVYSHLPVTTVLSEIDEIMAAAYSVSLFTAWTSDLVDLAWVKSTSLSGSESFFGAKLLHEKQNPVPSAPPENCTDQGSVGPWNDRLPHFRFAFQPSMGDELQAEYFVPRRHASAAFEAIHDMREAIAPHVYLSEIRSIAADDLWLSPHFERNSIAIHFTWKKEWDAVHGLLPEIEARLEPFGARPHWGKLFTMSPARIRSLYPKFNDFVSLINRYDPNGKFRNEYLASLLS